MTGLGDSPAGDWGLPTRKVRVGLGGGGTWPRTGQGGLGGVAGYRLTPDSRTQNELS